MLTYNIIVFVKLIIFPFFFSLCAQTDDLKLCDGLEDSKVLARKDLLVDTVWGPFSGSIQSDESANGVSNQVSGLGQKKLLGTFLEVFGYF